MFDNKYSSIISNIKLNRHPIAWIRKLNIEKNNLTFSKYEYAPHTINDPRIIFHVPLDQMHNNRLIGTLYNLKKNQDLALHSRIVVNNKIMHIPMIDFGGKNKAEFQLDVLQDLRQLWKMDFAIFDSGRSFHAYGDMLITHSQWIRFMGSLLLINKPGQIKLIDTRWIGHRILAEYSSLRWSCNSTQYKRYPLYIGMLSELSDLSSN